MSHVDQPGPVPPFFHDPLISSLTASPLRKMNIFFFITLIPLIVCGVSPSLSLTTCPHQGEKKPRFLLLGFVIEGKAFWSHWCALRENFMVNSKRVGRPRPEMRLHQIRPFAQSKMVVIFKLHLPRRKVKKKKKKTPCQLLESYCCKRGKGHSLNEERALRRGHSSSQRWSREASSINEFFCPGLQEPCFWVADSWERWVLTGRAVSIPEKHFKLCYKLAARERAPTLLSMWFLSLFKALN